mmetsp:Transcript_13016/g.22117  ORF Transcript_13016/g.22117 Transcript_13016/m.22117 type:complete len:83 (-) Transcript_13016:32-280(-)
MYMLDWFNIRSEIRMWTVLVTRLNSLCAACCSRRIRLEDIYIYIVCVVTKFRFSIGGSVGFVCATVIMCNNNASNVLGVAMT